MPFPFNPETPGLLLLLRLRMRFKSFRTRIPPSRRLAWMFRRMSEPLWMRNEARCGLSACPASAPSPCIVVWQHLTDLITGQLSVVLSGRAMVGICWYGGGAGLAIGKSFRPSTGSRSVWNGPAAMRPLSSSESDSHGAQVDDALTS